MKNQKIIFLGAGAANIWSVIYLLENGYNGKYLTIIDKGLDPYNRSAGELLSGFGGAGMFSDGKFVFSDDPSVIPNQITPEDKQKYYKFIQEQLIKRVGEENVSISLPNKIQSRNFLKNSIFNIRESVCYHLGTDNNIKFCTQLYEWFLKNGVEFIWGTEINDIDLDNNYLRMGQLFGNKKPIKYLFYDYLQVGLGKVGIGLIKKLKNKYNLELNDSDLHLGGRFECKYNDKVQELSNIQYDFKLYTNYDKIEVRTFCVNHKGAYVVEEIVDDDFTKKRSQFNGAAYKDPTKINNLTNFGIIFKIPMKQESLDSYLQTLLKLIDYNGVYLKGENAKEFTSSIDNFKFKCFRSLSIFPYMHELQQFINELNKLFELNDKWYFYFPEMKISLGSLNLDEGFNLKDGRYKNVGFVGDSCVATRGIVPAALTGIESIQKFIK